MDSLMTNNKYVSIHLSRIIKTARFSKHVSFTTGHQTSRNVHRGLLVALQRPVRRRQSPCGGPQHLHTGPPTGQAQLGAEGGPYSRKRSHVRERGPAVLQEAHGTDRSNLI